MKLLLIAILFSFTQSPVTVVKNNGDQIVLSQALFYQNQNTGTKDVINYSYRGKPGSIKIGDIKRISFKETVRKKKGVPTYRVILVRSNNTKLEVEMDMVKVEGTTADGKSESLGLGSIDKISF
ncbi:hypothetical protein [Ekhidna sp.]|jgi:hypothetical protein|uniref:hypothetical protein n=1 Tax=Ekhidna sp. TaxID=2608089 RepID=UPI0032EBCA7B